MSYANMFSGKFVNLDYVSSTMASPWAQVVRKPSANAGDTGDAGFDRWVGKNPWRRALQHSCLENPMNSEAWWATVHRVAKSQT